MRQMFRNLLLHYTLGRQSPTFKMNHKIICEMKDESLNWCLSVVLPAVMPAPAEAAAAESPAASAPPPAVYGYTPNQSVSRPASDAADQRATRRQRSKSEPRQPVTSAEQEIKAEGRRKWRFIEEA